MITFIEWCDLFDRLRLIETYFSFDPGQYNQLFNDELEKVIERTSDPEHRRALEGMRQTNWIAYVAASIRRAGFQDQREVQERTHDVVVKLLMGKLFRGFDERRSGPMDRRFKRSVANAIVNMIEKERNRRRFIPAASQDFQNELPARQTWSQDLIQNFRRLVKNQIGDLGLSVLDARLARQELKSLVGDPELGSPTRSVLRRIVREIKDLAKDFAKNDPGFLRQIERAVGREAVTASKRLATARQAAKSV